MVGFGVFVGLGVSDSVENCRLLMLIVLFV